MRRLRRSLLEGEEIVLCTRLHGSRLIRPLFTLALLAAVAAWGYLLLEDSGLGAQPTELVEMAGAALLVLLALRPLRRILQWRSHRFVLTGRRLLQVSGVLRKRLAAIPLERIDDVDLRRSLFGRLLGYGELGISTGMRVHRIGPLPKSRSIHAAVASSLHPAPPRDRPAEAASLFADPPGFDELPAFPAAASIDPPFDGERVLGPRISPQPVPAKALETDTPGGRGRVDEGFVFGGRYLLVRKIATGGMGTIYGGHDELLGRAVAIKLLREETGAIDSLERFRREARSAASLNHPNIASLFDYGEEEGMPYMVMELVKGSDLAHVLHREDSLESTRAARIALQVLQALDHAHEIGVIHRDIKPANVILERGDHVKVTDFGIARAAGQTTLTTAGVLLGSAPYVSPEQVSGQRVSAQSDIYSAGILLFEMLTGEPPFTGGSAFSVARKHVTDDVPLPSSYDRKVPKGLDRIVARATIKDPQARFRSAGQMAVALSRWLQEGETAGTKPATRTLRLSDRNEFDTPPLLG